MVYRTAQLPVTFSEAEAYFCCFKLF